jgi:glycosyltransferase involved in cell wall biosynthesis
LKLITLLKRKISARFNQAYNLDILIIHVKKIAKTKSKLVICPESTGPNWLGIKNATLDLFPSQTFVIPQEYSNQILTDADLKLIISTFKSQAGNTVLLSGFPNYFFKIIHICNELEINVEFLYHGGLAEINQNKNKQIQMAEILEYAKQGKLNKLYFIKEGLDKLFTKLTSVQSERIIPTLRMPENLNIQRNNDGKVHIGIFGNNSYNKNRHTQVAAAAMIDNSIIHIIGKNEFQYLINPDRVVCHNQLNRKAFLEVLGSMHINLYCSYSESWGQVVLESLALDVPCIAGNNSGLQNHVESEHKNLFIDTVDNPYIIAEKINEVINLYL